MAALNYEIQQMSSLPFCATQMIKPFLNSKVFMPIHDKVEGIVSLL